MLGKIDAQIIMDNVIRSKIDLLAVSEKVNQPNARLIIIAAIHEGNNEPID